MREEGAIGDKTQVPSAKYHHECIHNEKDRTEAPFSKIYLQAHLILWSGIKLTCKKNKRKE